MSLQYESLSALPTVGSEGLANNHQITLITAQGLVNSTLGVLGNFITAPLIQRLEDLEATLTGDPIPSIWPVARTLSLLGPVTGSVSMDGSGNPTLLTSIADNTLGTSKIIGLEGRLQGHSNLLNLVWTTGFSVGSPITTYGGDLNQLTGAVFLQSNVTTTNKPSSTGADFTILNNGPQNYANQLALRKDEVWSRSQDAGAWGSWYRHWTTANLDPATLLLKTDVAGAALKLSNARTFSLSGAITSSATSFDGTGNVILATSVADAALTIPKTAGLQASLDSKLSFKNDLDNTVDLNTVVTFGIYSSTGAFGRGALNYPVMGSTTGQGVLKVVPTGGGVQQIYRTYDDRIFVRTQRVNVWSSWIELVQTANLPSFLTGKMDVIGGQFTGDVTFSNTTLKLTGVGALSATNTWTSGISLSTSPHGQTTSVGGLIINGVSNAIELTSITNVLSLSLGAVSSNALTFNGQTVWNGGNLNPEMPVPASGVLYVGNSAGTHMRLRNDGRYSVDAGTTWREINEAPQAVTDPTYNSLSLKSDGIYFYSELAGRWNIRTGVNGAYKYFIFDENGNFDLGQGQIFVNGQIVWNAGNFNPASKLDATATAVAATKLASARTINGVAFDGTANITVPSTLSITSLSDMSVRLVSGLYQATAVPDGKGFPPLAVTSGAWYHYSAITHSNTSNNYSYQRAVDFGDVGNSFVRQTADNGLATWYRDWNEKNLPSPLDKSGGVMTGPLTSDSMGFRTPANQMPLITKGFGPFTSGKYNGVGRWGIFSEVNRLGFGYPSDATWDNNVVKIWRYNADSSIANEFTLWHTGNVTPLDRNTGGTIGNTIRLMGGTVSQQMTHLTLGWNNGVTRWAQVMESGAAFALYCYDPSGGTPTSVLNIANIAQFGQQVSTMSLLGGYASNGSAAGFTAGPRTSGNGFTVYADADQLRIWSNTAGADKFRFNADGGLVADRFFAGYDSGALNSMSCSNWFRSSGQTGLYFNDYGGGLYMTDSTWVRTYNGKSLYTAGTMQSGAVATSNITLGGNGNYLYEEVAGRLAVRTGTSGGGYRYFNFGEDGNFNVINGGVNASDFTISSDERLKDSVKTLEALPALRPVSYTRIATGAKEIGFIAQEVQQHYPLAVSVGQDGYLGVKYPRLTAILAAQVNHHSNQLQELASMKAEVESLANQLAELKAIVLQIKAS